MEDTDEEDSTMDDNDETLAIVRQPPPPTKRTKMDPTAPTAPDEWTDQTSPFTVVRHYRQGHVTDEQIDAFLQKNGIDSLPKLEEDVALLGSIIKRRTSNELNKMITAALNRSKQRPTEVLKGQLEMDETCIDRSVLNLFASEAVSVDQSWVPKRVRYPKVTLVMGPSGSGKTMFCIQELPLRVFRQGFTMENIFRVHVTMATLFGIYDDDDLLDLPASLVNYVHAKVAKRLSEFYVTGTGVPPIKLFLFVAIDEAGRAEYKPYLDEAAKISAFVTALEAMKDYKFTLGVHVTITGTALETSTKTIPSKVDVVKFRMRPWSQVNFCALLAILKRKDKNEVKAMVERFPILSNLTTNARCAYFLAESIPFLWSWSEEHWADHIQGSIATVANYYVTSNGLQSLRGLEDRFAVAKGIFKASNMAMAEPCVARFPEFDHIQDAGLRPITQSLLDVNVEILNGEAQFMNDDDKYSVSMTPAITIVLAELLCQKARIRWDWQGCQNNAAALGEWKRMITEMDASDLTSKCGIIYMRSDVVQDASRFTLPLVGRSTVLLNGPTALYADVMAPFRLVQVKYSVDNEQGLMFDFDEAMGNMGLTTSRAHRLKQAVTSVLYVMWQERMMIGCDNSDSGFKRLDCYEGTRCEHYPFETLLTGYVPVQKTANFAINWNAYVLPDDGNVEATNLINKKRITILEPFSAELPVTAVFVTNVKSFELAQKGRSSPYTIERHHVDWQGVLKRPLPAYLVKTLRKNVDVRFLFYGCG
jgi:hypothetical protein